MSNRPEPSTFRRRVSDSLVVRPRLLVERLETRAAVSEGLMALAWPLFMGGSAAQWGPTRVQQPLEEATHPSLSRPQLARVALVAGRRAASAYSPVLAHHALHLDQAFTSAPWTALPEQEDGIFDDLLAEAVLGEVTCCDSPEKEGVPAGVGHKEIGAAVAAHGLLVSSAESLGARTPGPAPGGRVGTDSSPSFVPLLVNTVAAVDLPGKGAPETTSSGFEVSWQSGRYDKVGTLMSATEVMDMVGHKGKLYAATSLWMNVPLGDPATGAQILRLDAPQARWQIDRHFDELLADGTPRIGRVNVLKSVSFHTDVTGQPLAKPVTLLVAGVTDARGQLLVYSRDDGTGVWTRMLLGSAKVNYAQVRSFGVHRDGVTGVDLLFAGASPRGIFSGGYDPTAPGRIRWSPRPEVASQRRIMAFSDVNGQLHAALAPRLLRRLDGPTPIWEQVLQYPEPPGLGEGLRALTPLPDPDGGGRDVLLGTFEGEPRSIVRILPERGYELVVELDVREFLRERWGGLGFNLVIAGYNSLTRVYDPHTKQDVYLIGLLAVPPDGYPWTSSWYLIRYPDATYDVKEVPALPHPFLPTPMLRGNRTMVVSPFPEHQGQQLYLGGYDSLFLPTRHTGWIYQVPVDRGL